MSEEQRLAIINRQMIAERQDLLNQLAGLRQELTQRNVDTATAAIRGVEALVGAANAGNPAARLALKTLLDALEAARTAVLGLTVVKS